MSNAESRWLASGRLEAARYGRQDARRYELNAALAARPDVGRFTVAFGGVRINLLAVKLWWHKSAIWLNER
jgi:hypothetical protein